MTPVGASGLRLDPDAEDVHITGLTFRAPRALPDMTASEARRFTPSHAVSSASWEP
jgi:hypothetical protein